MLTFKEMQKQYNILLHYCCVGSN